MASPLFHVGDLVLIDDKNKAYILEIDIQAIVNGSILYKVRYAVGNQIEDNVKQSRCRITTILSSPATTRDSHSSLNRCSPSSAPPTLPTSSSSTSSNATIRLTVYDKLKQSIKQSHHSKIRSATNIPLQQFLHDNKSKGKGWLRQTLPFTSKKIQLNDQENSLLLVMTTMFTLHSPSSGIATGWVNLLADAWGVSAKKINRQINAFVDSDFTCERKERSDKGTSIFNCEKKRKSTFTGIKQFKKAKHAEFRESTERLDHLDLKQEYNALINAEKAVYENEAILNLERSRYLWDELKDFLLKTKGKISFTTMSNHLQIVSVKAIREYLIQQEGWDMRKDRILPHLDSAAKARRVEWCCNWWFFWKSVRAVPVEKAIFALVHMDEKWFYAVRTRSNTKVLTSIGLEPNDYYAQHKNHIGKEMYIVATAFVLNANDITAGGKAIPIACVRVGKKVKAKKDSYKRVYNDDGTFSYPKLDANLIRRKGQMYFKSFELTGSSKGTTKQPKISLLKVYQEKVIPAIEEKVVERFSQNGQRKVIIVKQEDGAGLHTDSTYLRKMKREFNQRGWLLFNQPSQSPVTNVHDACIFPMMSKMVSKEQAVVFGSQLLKGEQLNECVMKVWQNKENTVAISRAFAGHHQIVNSILHYSGNNTYLSKKGGLSFGIRKHFVCDKELEGVIQVPLAPQEEHETVQTIIRNALKLPEPKLTDLPKTPTLTEEMKDLLIEHMEIDLMDDELLDVWAVDMFMDSEEGND